MALLVGCQAPAADPAYLALPRYLDEHMSRQQRVIDAQLPDGATVFFGDSITEALYTSAVATPSANFGIGGNTTAEVLARLPAHASLARARRVVLLIGINDLTRLRRAPADVVAGVARIVEKIPAGPRVTVVGLLPVRETLRGYGLTSKVGAVNAGLRALAAACDRCDFVEPSALADPKGQLEPAFDGGDGLHLSPAGYVALAALLRADYPRTFEAVP